MVYGQQFSLLTDEWVPFRRFLRQTISPTLWNPEPPYPCQLLYHLSCHYQTFPTPCFRILAHVMQIFVFVKLTFVDARHIFPLKKWCSWDPIGWWVCRDLARWGNRWVGSLFGRRGNKVVGRYRDTESETWHDGEVGIMITLGFQGRLIGKYIDIRYDMMAKLTLW